MYYIQQTDTNVWLLCLLHAGTYTPVGKFLWYGEEGQYCVLSEGEHLNLFVKQIKNVPFFIEKDYRHQTYPWQVIQYLIKTDKLDWPL